MPTLPIKGLPSGDAGRLLVRLNIDYREGVDRYGIAWITNQENGSNERVLLLGHDDKDAIFMPYDIREALGVRKDGSLNFRIEKVNSWGKLCWYLGTRDPAIHVPAWLAVIALVLSAIGAILGLISLIC